MRKGFIWGVATAALQIEGAREQDGKGMSCWDMYSDDEGFIFNQHKTDFSNDAYNHVDEDVKLMKELGINAYRFSISWPRVIPDGDGEINQKGLEFYSNLVDKLLAANIQPFITLFHWDLPYALYQKGGWLNKDIILAFKKYVKAVCERLADRVTYFITFNEPQCIIGGRLGGAIPDAKYSVKDKLTMVHNVLLCHGEAVKILRQYKNVKVGYAPCNDARIPYTNSKEDIEAARMAYFDIKRGDDGCVSIWSDPIVLGDYPEKYYQVHSKADLPDILHDDLKLISQPIDFYCQNIYQGLYVQSDGKGGYQYVSPKQNAVYTCMNWVVSPEALYWGPKFLYERYKLPFYISENGVAVTDIMSEDGKIHDAPRCEFLNQYIKQFMKAKEDGVDACGYFCWSLIDNFEWYCGYSKRFGLIYVDYETFKRTPKDSYFFYQSLISNYNK